MRRRTSRSRVGELVELGVDLRLGDLARRTRRARSRRGAARRPRRRRGPASIASASSGAGDRLGHVAPCAGADHRDHVLGGVGDREREEALRRARLPRPGGSPRPRRRPACGRRAGRRRAARQDRRDGLLDRPGVAENVDQVLELGAHAGAEQGVVVDDDDASAVERIRSRRRSPSIRSATSVPPPGIARDLASPPSRSIRPMIDSRTPRRSAGTAAGSKPGPRSRTNTSIAPVLRPPRRRGSGSARPRTWPRS